jgi:hypothetical protein
MKKLISPQTHGAMDYALSAANLVAPKALGMSRRAQLVFGAFGLAQGGVNAMTKQPYGVRKVIPFKVHKTIDASTMPALAVVPLAAGLASEPKARLWWMGLAAMLVAAFLLTDWDAKRPERR